MGDGDWGSDGGERSVRIIDLTAMNFQKTVVTIIHSPFTHVSLAHRRPIFFPWSTPMKKPRNIRLRLRKQYVTQPRFCVDRVSNEWGEIFLRPVC